MAAAVGKDDSGLCFVRVHRNCGKVWMRDKSPPMIDWYN